MWTSLRIAIILTALALCVQAEPRNCHIVYENRTECGWKGINRLHCLRVACCYDDGDYASQHDIPRCYKDKAEQQAISDEETENNGIAISPDRSHNPRFYPAGSLNTVLRHPPSTDKPKGNPNRLTLLALVQMKRDNVPQTVINSLLADAIPGGEWFYALQDGKLDQNELLELLPRKEESLEFSELLSYYLAGKNTMPLFYNKIADLYGVDPTVIELMMANQGSPVIKHLLAVLSANRRLNPLSSFVFRALASGGVTRKGLVGFIVDQIFRNENRFSLEAYKAFFSGDKRKALQWAFLASRQRNTPLKKYYPKNEALFAHFVDHQVKHTGRITPSMILSIALDQEIKALIPQKDFVKYFGIEAFDYVCASHTSNLQLTCEALADQPYHSSLDCIEAGCCLREPNSVGGRPTCFENIIGTIGVGIVEKVWDEDFIINNMFGGQLPTLENFYPAGIPWIPSTEIPSQYTSFLRRDPNQLSWFHSLTVNGLPLLPNPTLQPNTRPSRFRPDFVWKPHGVTPFPTELPRGTDIPGSVGYLHEDLPAPAPVVQALTSGVFASCRGVKDEDRYSCMSNAQALAVNGSHLCQEIDCCYDPVWTDLSIPACFRKANYGQCYLVEPEERQDCGEPGISKKKCLEDHRCCYDDTTTAERLDEPLPWCFFKKQSFVTDEEKCSRVKNADRVGCFPVRNGYNFNNIVTKKTCEQTPGCCYEKVEIGFFQRAIGVAAPPACYKELIVPIVPTVARPTFTEPPTLTPPAPIPPPRCYDRNELPPYSRIDCGNVNYHDCVDVKECCYSPEPLLPGAPWCYRKS